jgi:hypothetical protein
VRIPIEEPSFRFLLSKDLQQEITEATEEDGERLSSIFDRFPLQPKSRHENRV